MGRARRTAADGRPHDISHMTSDGEATMSDGVYKLLGGVLVLALVIDFIWVIKTALSVGH